METRHIAHERLRLVVYQDLAARQAKLAEELVERDPLVDAALVEEAIAVGERARCSKSRLSQSRR